MVMATVKIVILNWNGEEHLHTFLPSVVEHTPPQAAIVVIDNGSTDGSLAWLAATYPAIEVIALPENYGFTGGYNRALEMVEADYFVLLNSDVEATPGWLEPLVVVLDTQEDVAAVSPKLKLYADKRWFEYAGACGGFIDWLGYPFCRGRVLSSLEQDKGQYDTPRDTFWTSGACMLVRSAVFRELGGFDEKFFAHMEEIDLCWRMHLAGYRTMVEPRSVVYHLGGGTLPNNTPRKLYLNYRNNLAMIYKNAPERWRRRTLLMRMVLDALSAMVYFATGHFDFGRTVFRAHAEFLRWKPGLRAQRAQLRELYCKGGESEATRRILRSTVYGGSIVARYFLGLRRFGKLL